MRIHTGVKLYWACCRLSIHRTVRFLFFWTQISIPPDWNRFAAAESTDNRPGETSLLVYIRMTTTTGIASVADWDNEYARLARVASQLRTTGLRNNNNSANNNNYDTVASLQLGLSRLDAALSNSSSQLATYIPPAELQRRHRLVQHLQQQSVPNNTDDTNMGAATTESFTTSTGAQQLQPQSKMNMAMRQQDEMIDQLAVGVGRLKQQSTLIGEEANMHVHLISEMDTHLDAATASLQDQTRRAATLREEQSLWRLQLIVAALSVLLVLEVLFGLSP
jgi:hypothetical protein